MLTTTDHRPRLGLCGTVLAMSCFFVFGDAFALGLGKLRVKSALDEPLAAEIELTSVQDEELETLKARLSSREDFIRANVDRPEFLSTLKFEIATDAARPLIKVTTEQAAKEPFLHFLVTVEWAGGELIREYTALIDPPTYALDIPASVSSPRVVGEAEPEQPEQPEQPEAVDEATTSPAPAADEATAMASAPTTAAVRSGEYGPTQKGDTLWSIASKLDVGNAEINIFQIMIALLRENPNAFVNFNINRLKVGQILKLDDISNVTEISTKEASTVYTAHLEEWQAYRLQIAQASQTALVPAVTTEVPESTDAAGAVSTAAESESMAQPAATEEAKAEESPAQVADTTQAEATEKDVLRIVRANLDETKESAGKTADARAAEAEAQALKGQIQLLEETLTSRELENKELRDRVALLESQVEKTNRLIELQSEQMAQMQQRAKAEPPTPAEPPLPAAAVETEEKAAATEVAKAEVKQPAKPDVQAKSDVQPEAKAKAAAPKVADTPKKPAAKPKPKKKTAKAKAKAEPKKSGSWWQGIVDSLFSSWQYLVGLGVAAVALLVGLLQMIRRRRSIAEFEESILTGSVLDGQTDTTDTTRATAATDTSFLSDFGMAGMGTVQADEVDPLAESEVYLAYGRDEQAEEVLKEAIKKDSGRHELKLKLLEIYQQRNDVKAFETLAEELYPAGDQGDPVIWQQVVAMGRTMNPHNPLFSQELPAAVAASGDERNAEDLAAGVMSPEVSADTPLQPFPEPEDDSKLDEELDKLRDDAGAQQKPDQKFATGGGEPPAPEPVAEIEEPAGATMLAADTGVPDEQSVNELDDADFDLDFEALEAEAEQRTESELAEELSEGLDFELPAEPGPDTAEAKAEQRTDSELAEELAEGLDFELPAEPSPDTVEEAEQRVAKVMPLPGNKTTASAPAVEITPEATDFETPLQPATLSASAELEELSIAGVEAEAATPDAPAEEIKTNLEELAATVSDMDGVETAGEDQEQWDEAATKLDLARAYLDMGDKDGARSIIDEVLKQGNPTQRTQAQELANQLGG